MNDRQAAVEEFAGAAPPTPDARDTAFGADIEHDRPPVVTHHAASGLAYALAAYGSWGFGVPVYFWFMRDVGDFNLLAIRIVTGVPLALLLVWHSGRMGELAAAVRSWRTLRFLLLTTALITVNWWAFIHVFTTPGLTIQSSLGYYITPLLSVALGMFVLGERLRPLQWAAVGLAGSGVVVMAVGESAPTWALVLAFTFGIYGLLRKRASVGPLVGITVETANLLAPALAYLIWSWTAGELPLATIGPGRVALLACAGAITVLPLLWFNHAAQRLRLSTLGFIQFLAPTGQFLVAVLLTGGSFEGVRVVTFALIWLAILVFVVDSVRHHRHGRAAAAAAGRPPENLGR